MNFIKNIFVNSEKRLRSGWRVLFQFIAWIIILSLAQIFDILGIDSKNILFFIITVPFYIMGLALMFFILSRWIDKRPFRDYGFHFNPKWWVDLLFGFILGGITLSVIFFLFKSAGWLTVDSYAHNIFDIPFIITSLAVFLVLFVFAAGEELVFRGYMLRNLAEGFGRGKYSKGAVIGAFILSSAIFGLAHGGNPNASWASTLNIVLAGLLLGWGYVLTGELGISIGLHVGWNFFQEFIYGFPNSGQPAANWLFGSSVTGPTLWTGGIFGPEAGLLVTVLILVDIALILGWVRWTRKENRVAGELAEYGAKS